MEDLSPSRSIIILNVNGLNIPIKKDRLAWCVKKYDPTICIYKKLTSDIII